MIRRAAFTIIELLVVIAIIGLLTSVAAASYINAQRNARDDARKASVDDIATAVESYYRANQQYPGNIGNEATPPQANEQSAWEGCMLYNVPRKTIAYYYYPTSSTTAVSGNTAAQYCGSRTQTAQDFDPTQFQPATTWIPGLGAYLSPFPIETHYQGPDGQNTTPMDEGSYDYSAYDVLQGNPGYSLFYSHLINGYMVYTRLENSSSDAISNGTVFSAAGKPTYGDGTAVQVNSTNIFMIMP